MIGAELGNFRILELLGEGGMGVVYKGIDTSLDRLVAIKVLSSDLSRNPELVERFRAEARAQANLNHTNIATLYAFVAQADQAWMVMEYIEGETIIQMLQRRGLLPAELAVPLFKQALLGIGWAHRMGIVHRDIKPANLMVNRQGIVKVMDFGIAKVMGSGRGLTRTGTALGTAYYMSPEQVMNQPVDIRSDIYALGVTLYEMLTANLPFQGESDFHIMTSQVHAPPPPPTRYYPYIPKGTENAVLKAMAKDPAARFQTVEEFGAALEHPDDFGLTPFVAAPGIPGPGATGPFPPAPASHPPAPTPPPPATAGGRVSTPPPMATPPPAGPGLAGPTGNTPAPPPPTPLPTRMATPPPVTPAPPVVPSGSLLGTPRRKLIAGAAGLVLAAGILTFGLKKQHEELPRIPQGGGDTAVQQDKKPAGEVSVWPPPPADNAPTELKIVEFASDTKRVRAGQAARLRWSVQGATEVTITPAVGTVDAAGSKEVVIQRTTQFVLTAKKLGGEEVHQTVVVEAGTVAPEPARRLEVTFAAQPETLVAGQSARLSWSVPGAELVTIAPAPGRVPAAGTVTIKPAETTTYRLQARAGKGVTGEREVTVQVQPSQQEVFKPVTPPPPQALVRPEISFEASPNSIPAGGSATLSWNLRNATAASIAPQPGVLRQTTGKVAVSPATTTSYVLTARSKDNITETATAVVAVTAPTAPPLAPQRSSSAMVTVVHDHGGALNASAWPSCYGALQVVNGILRYTVAGSVDGRMDGFEVPVGQIQEVKLNRLRIRNQPSFHIMVRGQHLNFVATGMAAAQAVTEIEAAMPRR